MTPVGSFLRKTSFDEIPQLWHILKGEMSFVGPRPALYNQDDLVALREKAGIYILTPGLTGWAQIMGRDDVTIEEKVVLETEYLNRRSFRLDLYILAKTFSSVLARQGVSH
jgi:O-antigen biosynthesis protein WbqP